jgi:hypothetical protein
MAKTVKLTRAKKPAAKPRKTERAASAVRPGAKKVAKPAVKSRAVASAPKLNKEDMRVKLEKLEKAHATLRTKSREAAKTAAATIDELHTRIAGLEADLAARAVAPKPEPKPRRPRTPPPPPEPPKVEAPPEINEAEPDYADEEAHFSEAESAE